MISKNSSIEGSFDSKINYLYLNTNSDLIEYSGLKFKNNKISVNSLPEGVQFSYGAKSINVTDSFSLKNPNFIFTAKDKTTKLRFDVVLEVLNTKSAEAEAIAEAKEIKDHNAKILNLIAEKQDESLKGKSVKQLEAMLK